MTERAVGKFDRAEYYEALDEGPQTEEQKQRNQRTRRRAEEAYSLAKGLLAAHEEGSLKLAEDLRERLREVKREVEEHGGME